MTIVTMCEIEYEIYQGEDPYSEKGMAILKTYLADNNAYYYGRLKEDFNIHEAICKAEDNNAVVLILDNMS